jgi:hypothetical protein
MNTSQQNAIKKALSPSRLSTYEAATTRTPELSCALELYEWNADISAAMLSPLHVCEVVMRNAVSEAIEAAHGPRWPWDGGFIRSLPQPSGAGYYAASKDLTSATRSKTTTGQVIPDLKFVFWQKMFTSRFDARLWNHHLRTVLPHAPASLSVRAVCALVYDELEHLRKLRNRIAHHEPIFQRNLSSDFEKINDLVALRCGDTAAWMVRNQRVQSLIATKPV